ncbi:conserved domain protein [delta proteobacterium NaphS2]|nr:conserved domain protein [delta proteobacterium NaphS2]
MNGHDELLEKLSGMKILTEDAYDIRNRENTVRLYNLSAIVDLMRQTLEKEREALKACQLANAEILARFNQHSIP